MKTALRQIITSKPPEIPSWLRSSLVSYHSGGHRDGAYYPLTMKNEAYYTPSTMAEWNITGAGTTKGSGQIHLVQSSATPEMATIVTSLKSNTKYGLIYTVTYTDLNSNFAIPATDTSSPASAVVMTPIVGNNKAVFTTTSPIVTNTVAFVCTGANTDGKYIDFNSIRVFELPASSQIESDFTNLTADQLNAKYPFGNIEIMFGGATVTKAEADAIYAADGTNYWDGTRNVLCNPNGKYYWYDYSGRGRHMHMTNLAYTGTSNLDASGFNVDGVDDYGTIADSFDTRLTTGGTLLAWIKPRAIGENGGGRIFDKGTDVVASNGYELRTYGTNTILCNVNSGTSLTSSDNCITLGAWQLATATISSTDRALYVNAVNVTAAGGTQTALPPDVAGVVAIGNRAGATDRTFDGQIDRPMIIKRVLSQYEIQQIFNSQRRYYGV